MLQAHSFLWHYLWLAPNILQVVLAVLILRKKHGEPCAAFVAYLLFAASEAFILYGMDVLPWVSAAAFWEAFCVGVTLEAIVKFVLIAELFSNLLRPWAALAKLGNQLMSGTGAVLVLLAALAAAFAPIDNPQFAIISRTHILQQTLYIIQCGLVLFLFLFAAHFRLSWKKQSFGIALGLGIVSCEHLAAWAVMASGALLEKRHLVDLLDMATYHLCVLVWFYYLLIPEKRATTSAVSLPENNLAIWNRELERLLQQ